MVIPGARPLFPYGADKAADHHSCEYDRDARKVPGLLLLYPPDHGHAGCDGRDESRNRRSGAKTRCHHESRRQRSHEDEQQRQAEIPPI